MILGTWDVQGLKEDYKSVVSIWSWCSRNKGTKIQVERFQNLGEYNHSNSGVAKENSTQQCISILSHGRLRKYTTCQAIKERMIKIILRWHRLRLTIQRVYAINADDSRVGTDKIIGRNGDESINTNGTR